jgi:hypothetical protein
MAITAKSFCRLALAFGIASLSSTALAGEPIKFEKPPAQDLQAQVLDIFDNSCAFAGCHVSATAPKNLDLSEEAFAANLVNVSSAEVPSLKRVRPGDPANSYLVMKIKGSLGIQGDRMPRGSQALSAQDIATIEAWIKSLSASMKPAKPKRTYAQAFPGWSLANLQTAETLDQGAFLYRIAHRFKLPVNAGFDQLFGLDGGAFMMTQIAFPLGSDLSVTVERSGVNSTFEFGAKWRFLREKNDGSVPVSAALYAGVDWATRKAIDDPDPLVTKNLKRTAGERFAFFAQLPVTKQLGSRLSVMAVPGILINGNVALEDEDPLVTIGVGGRVALSDRYALFAELVPIVSGDETALTVPTVRTEGGKKVFNDTFTAGLEIKAGGHVFHLFVSNSAGNTTNQYMSGGDYDFAGGDFRIGFNIYRVLNYPF